MLEYGKESRYAPFPILTVAPTDAALGDTFDAGKTVRKCDRPDPATGKPALAYYDNYYPLAPATWQREVEILALTDKAAIADRAERQPWKLMRPGAMPPLARFHIGVSLRPRLVGMWKR